MHSSFSNRPSVWAMRKINCPESFTYPHYIYHQARKLGMNYVTITDHNTINGALEIAHLPGAFLGVEVTTYFPENGCKVHVVVLDITENQFNTLMHLRKNIYEMIEYLRMEGRVHFIAHPLYDMDGKLTPDTIEKIFLLFNTIEVKNGSHAGRLNQLTRAVVQSLTSEMIDTLADKHTIAPFGSRPWKKSVVGGSDDHSSFFIARAHTISGEGETLEAFMDALRNGRTDADGEDGDVLTLAHSIYGIAYRFYLERIRSNEHRSAPFVNLLLNTYFRSQPEKQSLVQRVRFYISRNIPEMYDNYENKSFEEILDKEVKKLLNDRAFISQVNCEKMNEKIFTITSYLANRMIYIYTSKVFRKPLGQGIFDAFRSVSTIGLVHFLVSPYYISYYTQHRDKKLLEDLSRRLLPPGENARKEKIALFTDTLDEINGVAITIRRLAAAARQKDVDLTIITCSERERACNDGVKYFKSVGDFLLPEYPELKLHFPPVLDILNYIEKEGFTRIHSSTPGTMGLAALLVAKLMDIPITGTYHTDIPNYVGDLTDDAFLKGSAWNFIIWFYNQMDEVTVPSKST
ncbi:MAG: glycosyltransferase, partial [Deltaproteobacteria bacterium]|nr:glycosyltransferase [Deltaproteobacteria bacterium]